MTLSQSIGAKCLLKCVWLVRSHVGSMSFTWRRRSCGRLRWLRRLVFHAVYEVQGLSSTDQLVIYLMTCRLSVLKKKKNQRKTIEKVATWLHLCFIFHVILNKRKNEILKHHCKGFAEPKQKAIIPTTFPLILATSFSIGTVRFHSSSSSFPPFSLL